MDTRHLTAIHKRGLIVLALAIGSLQVPFGDATARRADPQAFQAKYNAMPARDDVSPVATCTDVTDVRTSERGCSSSMTGGPAGGLSDRN